VEFVGVSDMSVTNLYKGGGFRSREREREKGRKLEKDRSISATAGHILGVSISRVRA
jgi:curli biogenesis system outer membrane secretion channel CsgG